MLKAILVFLMTVQKRSLIFAGIQGKYLMQMKPFLWIVVE